MFGVEPTQTECNQISGRKMRSPEPLELDSWPVFFCDPIEPIRSQIRIEDLRATVASPAVLRQRPR